MQQTPYNVLFLCTGNSARSIFGEVLINALGAGRFRGFSAGSQPKGEVHPEARQLLESLHFSTAGLYSKSWDDFAAPRAPGMDFVFTVCDDAAREACPVWPGQPMTAHWGIADPAAVTGDAAQQKQAFRTAFYALQSRIRLFLNLPIASIDRLALQREIEALGEPGEHTS